MPKSFNGDGFSEEMKNQVIETIRKDFGKVDMVVYSMAAPRRTMPDGTTVSSVLKTVGKELTNKTIDLRNNEIKDVIIGIYEKEFSRRKRYDALIGIDLLYEEECNYEFNRKIKK